MFSLISFFWLLPLTIFVIQQFTLRHPNAWSTWKDDVLKIHLTGLILALPLTFLRVDNGLVDDLGFILIGSHVIAFLGAFALKRIRKVGTLVILLSA